MVDHFELVVFRLLVAVASLVLLSEVLEVPYPSFLVLGRLILGFIPGVPEVEVASELVLLIFLPPLLYVSAFFSSLRNLRANIRPIGLLSVGLVALTTGRRGRGDAPRGRALVAGGFRARGHRLTTDPAAATAIAERLGVPRRIVTSSKGRAL